MRTKREHEAPTRSDLQKGRGQPIYVGEVEDVMKDVQKVAPGDTMRNSPK